MSLTSYTGQKLNIAGVNIRHKNENRKLEFYVVRSKAPCILGLSDSTVVNFIKEIDTVKKTQRYALILS